MSAMGHLPEGWACQDGRTHNWLKPEWPVPDEVGSLCTTRSGGHSQGLFGSMNLGAYVGDAPASLAANVASLREAIALQTPDSPVPRVVFNRQVHGASVHWVGAESADGLAFDASCTADTGVVCTALAADCLPVLFCALVPCGLPNSGQYRAAAVAAAHAGWRGLANGVLEAVLHEICHLVQHPRHFTAINSVALKPIPRQAKILAWLGPCIGPLAFEVGAEVAMSFDGAQGSEAGNPQQSDAAFFKPKADGKYLANLSGLARARLLQAGVAGVYGNDGSLPWCTVANPSSYFSHRRDGALGVGGSSGTGRMAACIWLR